MRLYGPVRFNPNGFCSSERNDRTVFPNSFDAPTGPLQDARVAACLRCRHFMKYFCQFHFLFLAGLDIWRYGVE